MSSRLYSMFAIDDSFDLIRPHCPVVLVASNKNVETMLVDKFYREFPEIDLISYHDNFRGHIHERCDDSSSFVDVITDEFRDGVKIISVRFTASIFEHFSVGNEILHARVMAHPRTLQESIDWKSTTKQSRYMTDTLFKIRHQMTVRWFDLNDAVFSVDANKTKEHDNYNAKPFVPNEKLLFDVMRADDWEWTLQDGYAFRNLHMPLIEEMMRE